MGNKTFSNELLHSDRTVPITLFFFFCVTETYFAQEIHTLFTVYFDVAFFMNCKGGFQLELLFLMFLLLLLLCLIIYLIN